MKAKRKVKRLKRAVSAFAMCLACGILSAVNVHAQTARPCQIGTHSFSDGEVVYSYQPYRYREGVDSVVATCRNGVVFTNVQGRGEFQSRQVILTAQLFSVTNAENGARLEIEATDLNQLIILRMPDGDQMALGASMTSTP